MHANITILDNIHPHIYPNEDLCHHIPPHIPIIGPMTPHNSTRSTVGHMTPFTPTYTNIRTHETIYLY